MAALRVPRNTGGGTSSLYPPCHLGGLPASLFPKLRTQPPPIYKGISSLRRPPTGQPVRGATAGAGRQCRHVPLLCQGQPGGHPVQVRATAAEAGCHCVLGIPHSTWFDVGALCPSPHPATPSTPGWARRTPFLLPSPCTLARWNSSPLRTRALPSHQRE